MGNDIKEIYLKGQEKFNKKDFFTTGFDDLDVFCKCFENGNILTIGGRPAMGKTAFATSLVNHLLDKGKSILYFSMDCSKVQCVSRLVAEKMGVHLFSIIEGKVSEKETDIVLDSYKDKNLEIVDKINLTIEDIETKIQETKPDIVFIDYVQLIEAPKAPNLTEATNLVIKELKRIAVENDVIVVLLSQLSRAVEARCNKRPLLSDLRNGSLLEEISDIIFMIYRESYYDPDPVLQRNEIIIEKNTVGPTGTICLDFKNGFFKNPVIDNTL